ncbi:hypothetical protein D3C79_942250 [compost metagenome]
MPAQAITANGEGHNFPLRFTRCRRVADSHYLIQANRARDRRQDLHLRLAEQRNGLVENERLLTIQAVSVSLR